MKVSGDHDFVSGRDAVWGALHDPQVLAATLPGARRLDPTGPNEYAMTVDVGVGSVKGTYAGTFSLADTADREACTVRATASGRPGSVQAVAQMRLADGERGARLTYEADATVTGPLAGVGQRLMAAAARRTTEQFLSALDDHLRAPAGAAAAPASAPAGAAAAPASAPAGAAAAPASADGAPAAASEGPRSRDLERVGGAASGRTVLASALAGGLLALLGVAVGRWTARR